MSDVSSHHDQPSNKCNRGYSDVAIADRSPLTLKLGPNLAISSGCIRIERKYRQLDRDTFFDLIL